MGTSMYILLLANYNKSECRKHTFAIQYVQDSEQISNRQGRGKLLLRNDCLLDSGCISHSKQIRFGLVERLEERIGMMLLNSGTFKDR